MYLRNEKENLLYYSDHSADFDTSEFILYRIYLCFLFLRSCGKMKYPYVSRSVWKYIQWKDILCISQIVFC